MSNTLKYIGFIFAKKISSGLPNKNIMNFNGMPLIAHTIKQAQESQIFDDIVVSTDCSEIAAISIKYGASVPFMRPSRLAEFNTPEIDCWKHAINEYRNLISDFDYFVSLPCTSPLRTSKTIQDLINSHTLKHDLTLCVTPSSRSPYFNIVKKNNDDTISLVVEGKFSNRQEVPVTYDVTTVGYISTPKYILNANHLFDGKIGSHIVEKRISIDIDDINDFNIAQSIANNINFEK